MAKEISISIADLVIPSGLLRDKVKAKPGTPLYDRLESMRQSMEERIREGELPNYDPIDVWKGKKGDVVSIGGADVEVEGRYVLSNGLQRSEQAKLAWANVREDGVVTLSARVIDKSEATKRMISANFHRVETSPGQYASFLRGLVQENPSIGIDELSAMVAMSVPQVKRLLAVSSLNDDLKSKLDDKSLSIANASLLVNAVRSVCRSEDERKRAEENAVSMTATDYADWIDGLKKEHKKAALGLDEIKAQEYVHKPKRSLDRLADLGEQIKRWQEAEELDGEEMTEHQRGQRDAYDYIMCCAPEDIEAGEATFKEKQDKRIKAAEKREQQQKQD